MGTFAKITALQVNKQKKFRILLVVELLLLVMGIVGLFGKNAEYQYYPDDTGVNFSGIALPRGTYRVQMYYTTDTNMKHVMEVTAPDMGKESLRINTVSLFAGWDHTDEEMWLLRDTEQLSVHANFGDEGNLQIHGLKIKQTNAMNRIYLFALLCLFTAINGVYLYGEYDRKYSISLESKTVTFLLGTILLFASIPIMLDYMWSGGDLTYHLFRVEGIKDGILNGYFPIRISPQWQQGYGYASPIFYGETVLYIAALFRLIGFSVVTSYRLFLLVITIMTLFIAYFCYKKTFENRYIGVLCGALQTLAVYRTHKLYGYAALGEGIGMMFLPLLVYGFYKVFASDVKEKDYGRSWLPLTLGFAMVVQSHLLTGELAGVFTILLCVILWKKVFRVKTFVVLAKAAIYSVLLSAWFLVPFLDYMLTGDFVIHHVSGRQIQNRGGFVAHALYTFFENGGGIWFQETGMKDSTPAGMGIALIVGLGVFGYLLLSGKLKAFSKEMKALGTISAVFGILAMVMSLGAFPWDKIQSLSGLAATLVSSLQFPHRLFTIANICLVTVVGVVAKYFYEMEHKKYIYAFLVGMAFCMFCSNVYLLEDGVERLNGIKVYNPNGMGTGYISGAEYLPYGADATLFMPHNPVVEGDVIVEGYEKKPLGATAYITNMGETEGSVSFALLYYKGYQAYGVSGGEKLNCYAGENFEVTVDVPAGFDGMLEVGFESPLYWRVGEIVTVVSSIFLLVFVMRRKSKREEQV